MSGITWFLVILTLILVPIGIIFIVYKETKRPPEIEE